MLIQFALIAILGIVAAGFVFVSLFAGRFFRPRNPNPVKASAYDCGEVAVGPAWINFNMRFYIIALIFVIFDVEVALMFPVAAVFREWIAKGLGVQAFVEIIVFVLILFAGLIYVWAKKDLRWIKKMEDNVL